MGKRNEHTFTADTAPRTGRPRLTPGEKLRNAMVRKYAKSTAADFRARVEGLLPLSLQETERILSDESADDSVKARLIEAIWDRVYGRPKQELTGPAGGPLLASFTAIVSVVDGARHEKLPTIGGN